MYIYIYIYTAQTLAHSFCKGDLIQKGINSRGHVFLHDARIDSNKFRVESSTTFSVTLRYRVLY